MEKRTDKSSHNQQSSSPQDHTPETNFSVNSHALNNHDLASTADLPPDPELIMSLQRTIGNSATIDLMQQQGRTRDHRLVQRSGGGAGTKPAADPTTTALAQLRTGKLLEKNTAEMIDTGKITTYYIDECPPDPKSTLPATSPFKDVLHPKTKKVMRVQKNFQGFAVDRDIFINRSVSINRVKSILIHEINHTMRHDKDSDKHAGSFARYRDEFQAYWIAEYSGVADLNKRAQQIRKHILADYVDIQDKYSKDADFKKKVDNHTRPDGNVINSSRWEEVLNATKGAGTNEKKVFTALNGMSAEERKFVRGNNDFMKMLKNDFGYDDMLKAYLILYDFSKSAVGCVDAVSGGGTDEKALFKHLNDLAPKERKRLREYGSFMDRLKRDLSNDELLKTYLILYDFSKHAVACVDAVAGAGSDEEAIYSHLLEASSAEHQRLKSYGSFMDRLRADLNDSEMEVVEKILAK